VPAPPHIINGIIDFANWGSVKGLGANLIKIKDPTKAGPDPPTRNSYGNQYSGLSCENSSFENHDEWQYRLPDQESLDRPDWPITLANTTMAQLQGPFRPVIYFFAEPRRCPRHADDLLAPHAGNEAREYFLE
jgi:hypothetical protein